LTFTGRAVGSERVADEWERIEASFGRAFDWDVEA
jgi:hypothetical protein